MWTDGRYFLQASEEMDKDWTLMKEGEQKYSINEVNEEAVQSLKVSFDIKTVITVRVVLKNVLFCGHLKRV